MVERHAIMLKELLKAIAYVTEHGTQEENSREAVLFRLRMQHGTCVRVHAYVEAWCIHGVIQMIDDSPTVNDILKELRALDRATPHTNRGVGFITPLSFSSNEGNDDAS